MSEDEGHRVLDLRERAIQALTAASAQPPTGLLQDIIAMAQPLEDKYHQVDVTRVLRENVTVKPSQGLEAVSRAFNILDKYGRNLLSPTKPKFWRAVKFNNPVFKTTVDGIQGSRDILRQYGYTVEQSDGMCFPEDVPEPDRRKVAAVTIEVAMLQLELELLHKDVHPHPELFSPFLPGGGVSSQPQSVEQAPSLTDSDSQEPSQAAVTA
uniref:E3 ubiquitin-protein ligase RNF31-like n=1 Tax=Pristiophorus japonicus TaxID=55135 RepID=UPI00398F8788